MITGNDARPRGAAGCVPESDAEADGSAKVYEHTSDSEDNVQGCSDVAATPGVSPTISGEAKQWEAGGAYTCHEIDGRYELGDPGTTFFQSCHIATQTTNYAQQHDICCDANVAGDLEIMCASLRGSLHATKLMSSVRQDDYAFGVDAGGRWLIAAVADGVSEAERAHELSSFMARQTVLVIGRSLTSCEGSHGLDDVSWNGLGCELLGIAQAYCRHMMPQATDIREWTTQWATTLEFLVVALRPEGEGYPFASVSVAGDGAVYVLDPLKGWRSVKDAKRHGGTLVSNAVHALPANAMVPCVSRGTLCENESLLLVTDGLGDVLADGSTPLGGLFQTKLPHCHSVIDYLKVVDTWAYQADDDRTAVLVRPWREASHGR